MLARSPTLFAQWLAAIGLNRKQVSKGGALIGLTTAGSVRRNQGDVEPSLTDLLAMSAVRAGLPAWSPKTDAEIAMVGEALKLLRGLAENHVRAPPKTT